MLIPQGHSGLTSNGASSHCAAEISIDKDGFCTRVLSHGSQVPVVPLVPLREVLRHERFPGLSQPNSPNQVQFPFNLRGREGQ